MVPDSKKLTRSIPVPLCDIAKCQLCEVARITEPSLRDVARRGSKPAIARARPKHDFILPEAELCQAARATRRVNALSPIGAKPIGQWDLYKDAVGLRTPTATV